MDRHPPSADQHVLAAFIAEGYLDRHIRKMRGVYAEKRRSADRGDQHAYPLSWRSCSPAIRACTWCCG